MRVVIDPNVLVSAVITDGISARLIDRWLTDRSFELVACHTLFEELRDVLSRPRFRRWVSIEQATLFIDLLKAEAEDWRVGQDGPRSVARPHRSTRSHPMIPRTTTSSLCSGTAEHT